MPKRIDLTGAKIGELTVIGYSHSYIQPSGQKRAIWNVKCSCGEEKKMSTGTLRNGSTVSCGHIGKINRIKSRVIKNNGAEKNYLFLAYKHSAKNRDIKFNLTKKEFIDLINKQCIYCGSEPSNIKKSRTSQTKNFLYNGIDRLDNDIGYITGNVVTCCATCNFMKRNMSYHEFINHIDRIHFHAKERL